MSSKVKKNGRNGGKKLFKGENMSKVILAKHFRDSIIENR
jgi:hypothetical protein